MATKGVLLLILCVFDTTLLAGAASECPSIFISGTEYQTSREGKYQMTEGTCNGRSVYIHSEGDNYLYFISGTSSNHWLVGSESCSSYGFIQAYDSATYPQDITAVWQEYNGMLWRQNGNIKVECECTVIVICGTKYQELMEGEYYPTEEVCNTRMVYIHSEGDNYLYFISGPPPDYWLVGPSACYNSGGMIVFDSAIYPYYLTAVWREYDGYHFVPNENIAAECYQCRSNNEGDNEAGRGSRLLVLWKIVLCYSIFLVLVDY